MCTILALGCAFLAFAQSSADPVPPLRDLPESNVPSMAAFQLGERYIREQNFQSAANEFRDALNGDQDPPWIVVWSHIQLARIFERTNQRARAVLEYTAAVRTGDNTGGALDEALKFLKDTGSPIPDFIAAPRTVPAPGEDAIKLDQPPQPLTDLPPPDRTDDAEIARLEGTVWVTATVGVTGEPRDARVTHSIGLGLDEKALETVRNIRFRPGRLKDKDVEAVTTIPVDFPLPSKQSRWHLVQAAFHPDGASPPVFRSVSYPFGPGISRELMDEGRVLAVIGRQVVTKLSFLIDETGHPAQFKLDYATDPRWGPDAIAVVQNWLFTPGIQAGRPVPVPCTLTLVWGSRSLGVDVLRNLLKSR